MGHLNEMHEKFKDKGVTILAVTNEDRSKVDEFITKNSPEFPIVIEESDSAKEFGIGGFPSAFLIAPDGTIVKNSFGEINDAAIEELLPQVKLFPDIPKSLKSVERYLEKSKFAHAHDKLAKAIEGGKLSDEDKAAAEELTKWIEWSHTSLMESAGKAAEKEDWYKAWSLYDQVGDEYKGMDVAARAVALAKEILADKAKKLEVDAGKKFAKLRPKLRDMSDKKAVNALKALTGKKYGDTKAGKAAAKIARSLDKD